MKNFSSRIRKFTWSDNPDVEEYPCIEGCANQNIKDNYNLTPKNLPVYYSDMLLPLTNIFRVKINDVLSVTVVVVKY